MKTLKIILTIILLLSVAYAIFFASIFIDNDKSTAFLESELTNDRKTFEEIANRLLSDSSISYISVQGNNENGCQIINKWRKCPNELWVNEISDSTLSKTAEVLLEENISFKNYDVLVQFMNKHGLKSIISLKWLSCVNFEASYNGLRYSSIKDITFQPDHEYLIVNKVDANWFSYERDKN